MKYIQAVNKPHPKMPICPKSVKAMPEPFEAPKPMPRPYVFLKISKPDIMIWERTSAELELDLLMVISTTESNKFKYSATKKNAAHITHKAMINFTLRFFKRYTKSPKTMQK